MPLGLFPSPVEEHPELARSLGAAALWVKREDLNGTSFGGNKLRALEFLLPATPRAAVTMGGYGSTWCAALALCQAARGRRAFAALFPQPWSDAVAGSLGTTLRHGSVHLASRRFTLPAALLRAWHNARAEGPPGWIPAGGAAPRGVLGSVGAALEFVRQLEGARVTRPDAIVVPLGTGGTAAGLLVGCWLAAWPVEICAVRVTDPWFSTHAGVMRLARGTLRLLRRCGCAVHPGPARLRIIADQLGPGYGHPTDAARAAGESARRIALTLEVTYGAKAWAALRALAPSFPRLCFWHTFDSRLAGNPPLDHPLLRQARAHSESLWPHLKST